MAGDIDRPDHHLFTADQLQQIHRHPRVVALERDNIEGGFLQLREGLLILSPLRTQRFFPVGIRLDAVAVADMHRRLALQPFGGSFQRGDPPVVHLIEEDVEGRLIELNNIDPGGL